MIESVLIANRSEIAVRIAGTLRRMGVRAIGVYATSDADSLHVEAVDECFALGDGGAAQTYLNQDRIFEIIAQSDATAVHPGYGFLSENAEFADRVERAGLAFIGPTSEQIRSFGLKHVARKLAQEADVPLVPGTGLLESAAQAVSEADVMGYPVMLKSTAGGGGIGMRVCGDAQTVKSSFESVQRTAKASFGDAAVFLERYVERARHIEVQIFGDGNGRVSVLGDRDCSVQRRNQKVVEECPAVAIADSLRRDIHESARRLGESVAYRSAGTVEFLYDVDREDFYFLEVNTRLQVEHAITEAVYGIDLVEMMVRQAAGERPAMNTLAGHGFAIEARVYAENPARDFLPSAGLVQSVSFPPPTLAEEHHVRVDSGIRAGATVSPFFDPMLAKVIVHGADREQALEQLSAALDQTDIHGIETNVGYLRQVARSPAYRHGAVHTRFLDSFDFTPLSIDIIEPGPDTAVQAAPGRKGLWDVGVPPSGPMDELSFRLGNRLLGNNDAAAGLEMTTAGATLRFNSPTAIVISGAALSVSINGAPQAMWEVLRVAAGDELVLGRIEGAGVRSYLLVEGGLDVPDHHGSAATFALGQIGGHCGRKLVAGDVLRLREAAKGFDARPLKRVDVPDIGSTWVLRVVCGPHGAPDFFTADDIERMFAAEWEVHYNSSRTGVRLIGPQPTWARTDGGEAGLHPSNIHDNAYAFGALDYTGDMPVILGPDGPSLGGFVCPASVINADRWKLGQLKAGDIVKLAPVDSSMALQAHRAQDTWIANGDGPQGVADIVTTPEFTHWEIAEDVVVRRAGQEFLLVEFGPAHLEIAERFRVHALMTQLGEARIAGLRELTPGIRSLQIHFDSRAIDELAVKGEVARALGEQQSTRVRSRILHLPLSWDDPVCRQAAERYQRIVRPDAPWCPDNIEFIRRINGMENTEDVRGTVFDASYLVMGLGDVYLGAPVATPLDPRHRLVTTKYNPARTWTAENSVGIGGAYLCIYGMEGPGGYQLFGRTLQVWNRYRSTPAFERPWLLRFFDQIRFFEVSSEELTDMREAFPRGRYDVKIDDGVFDLDEYQSWLSAYHSEISAFTTRRTAAFNEELAQWRERGLLHFEADGQADGPKHDGESEQLPEGVVPVSAPVTGSVWSLECEQGQTVAAGDPIMTVESMKTEFPVLAPASGRVLELRVAEGKMVRSGDVVATVAP